jgi:pimeloyl-ACP methyl ester carboxylesterase
MQSSIQPSRTDVSSDDENTEDENVPEFIRVGQSEQLAPNIQCEEVRIRLPSDLTVAGRLITRLDSSSDHLAVAVHGWLDNANSMVPVVTEIMKRVPAMYRHVLCIDVPGCGQSEHKHAPYPFLEISYDIFQATQISMRFLPDIKSRSKVTLIGHSAGGALSILIAAWAPDLVERLIILDIMGPISVSPDQTLAVFQRNFKKRLQVDSRRNLPRKIYSTKDRLVKKLQSRFQFGIESNAALQLIERGSRYVENEGWQFTYDPYHIASFISFFTEQQLEPFLKAIICPMLVVWTTKKLLYNYETRTEIFKNNGRYTEIYVSELKDRHHFHLEQPEATADIITDYLKKEQQFLSSKL